MFHTNKKHAFTLVELMLAMGFVSALLLAIAMTVIQISNIYTRGLTFKNVNQAGSAMANELQRSLNGSVAFYLDSSHYINSSWGGRLCTGQYTYIWNYGKDISSLNTSRNVYTTPTKEIHFIKIYDTSNSYCITPTKKPVVASSVELMDASQYDLTMHDFKISTTDSAYDSTTGQRLYSISFLIGTNDQLAFDPLLPNSPTCLISGSLANPNFCAVNRFDILTRSGSTFE